MIWIPAHMQEMGLEPTRIATTDFESAASAIPPLLLTPCAVFSQHAVNLITRFLSPQV